MLLHASHFVVEPALMALFLLTDRKQCTKTIQERRLCPQFECDLRWKKVIEAGLGTASHSCPQSGGR